LTHSAERLHAQLNGASALSLTEARQNLEDAVMLFAARGFSLDGDL
jgi:hypothetical protein